LSTTLLFAIAKSFRSRLPEDSQFGQ